MADTTRLTSFPNKVDTFERVSDLSAQQGTFAKSNHYKSLIDSGKYNEAEQYLRDNEDLARCAVNASMHNKHSDALVALEENVLSMDNKIDNGLTSTNNKLDAIQSKFYPNTTETNSVLLNTTVNGNTKSSAKIKGDSYISVGCAQNNMNLSLKYSSLARDFADFYSPSTYVSTYGKYKDGVRNKKLYTQRFIIRINSNSDGTYSEDIDFGDIIQKSDPENIPVEKIDIVDITGYIATSRYRDFPEYCYPLNSAKCRMYWSNGFAAHDSYGSNSNYNPTIHIETDELTSVTSDIKVDMVVKFIFNDPNY